MDKNDDLGKKIKDLIEKSGNGFHYRVVSLLRENDWKVIVSPYYSDSFTNKSREVDIVAHKKYAVQDVSGQYLGDIYIRMFIECKYINSNNIFWFDEKDIEGALDMVKRNTMLSDDSMALREHRHISDNRVAKLFYSESARNDNDPIYRAINQCLNAMIYYRRRNRNIYREESRNVMKIINYPLIVCNSFEKFFLVYGNG